MEPLAYPYTWRIKPQRRPDSLWTAAADFLEHERARNFSLRTVQMHDYWLSRFIAFCEERGVSSVHDVTRPVVVRFQRFLFYFRRKNGRPLGYSSQSQALGAVRVMFRYLTKAGTIHANPAADLELPRREQKLPRHVLTVDEVERVMTAGVASMVRAGSARAEPSLMHPNAPPRRLWWPRMGKPRPRR